MSPTPTNAGMDRNSFTQYLIPERENPMCNFQHELEIAIAEFTDNRQSFTSWDVRNKIRSLFGIDVRYRETNYAVLTFMQHNSSPLEYIVESIEVITDPSDPSQTANVWQFTPVEVFQPVAKPEKKTKKGFFAKLFN